MIAATLLGVASTEVKAQSSLSVNFVTTSNGGNYSPKNIVAVWIQGPGGTFQKTIGRWANSRKSHLVAWTTASGSDTDAVSGATRSNHNGTLTVTWDLKNRSGAVVPDGTYTIRMEECDSNASNASQNHQGTFTFVKGPTSSTQNTSGGGFNSVVITYTAGGAANMAPTVATAATATPTPATGTTTNLSVLGADDNGEPALTYTWAKSSGPGTVTFSANGTNAAKASVATFSLAGTYSLTATIKDAAGLTATSAVNVTVNATATSVSVTPASTSVTSGATQQFVASAKDQFGVALASQPAMTWTVSGGGTISATGLFTAGATAGGPFTVTATGGGKSGTATLSVGAAPVPTVATAAAANPSTVTATTSAVSVLGADIGGEPNLLYTWSATGPGAVSFSPNGTNAAKASTATFAKVGSYTLTATIANSGGKTVTSSVNVTVNATLTSVSVAPSSASLGVSTSQSFVATGTDQFGAAMGTQPTFTWTVSGGGTIASNGTFTAGATAGGPYTVTATSGAKSATATVTVTTGSPPTVATPAAASPSNVVGKTTAVSVLGADVSGEASLKYAWAKVSGPGTVTFVPNGTNAAKAATATFSAPGNYVLSATITNLNSLSNSSNVSVTVASTLTALSVTPATTSLIAGGTQLFSATGVDQFGANYAAALTPTWSVSGGGTIAASGMFTAGSAAGGPFTVTATSGSITGTAQVSVTAQQPPTIAQAAKATPALVTGTSTLLGVLGADSAGEAGLTYTWSCPTASNPVTFSANATNAAKAVSVTFEGPGTYPFVVTVTNGNGLSVTSSVTVTVVATASAVSVAPPSATLAFGGKQQFTASAVDQFNVAMTTAPTFTWALASGCTGCSLSNTGLFTAGSMEAGPFTVTATASGKSGTAQVSVAAGSPPTLAVGPAADESPVLNTTTRLSALGADAAGESTLVYTWSVSPPGPLFSANGTNAAKSTGVTFQKPGDYEFNVTIENAQGLTISAALALKVVVSVKMIDVSPPTAEVPLFKTLQFTATADDQFGHPVTPTPLVVWSATGAGSISSSGLFTAGGVVGTARVRGAAGGVTQERTINVVDTGMDTTPPTVSVLSPLNGADISGALLMRAGAVDKGGIARVVFRIDGADAVELTQVPYEARFDSTTLSDGAHVLDAVAFDNAGNRGFSEPVNINVKNGAARRGGCQATDSTLTLWAVAGLLGLVFRRKVARA